MIHELEPENYSNEQLIQHLEEAGELTETLIFELLRRSADDEASPEGHTFAVKPTEHEKYAEAAQALQRLELPEDLEGEG